MDKGWAVILETVKAHERTKHPGFNGGYHGGDISEPLSPEEVRAIRRSTKTVTELCKEYDRARKVIRNVIKHRTYTSIM